jgi:hypothetical protein
MDSRCFRHRLMGFLMANFRYEWFLFGYKDGAPDVISRPFKTKAAAEKARGKHPPKVRGRILGIRNQDVRLAVSPLPTRAAEIGNQSDNRQI